MVRRIVAYNTLLVTRYPRVQINVPVADSVRLNKSYCNIFQNPQNYELTDVNFDDMSRVSSPAKLNIQPRPMASCLCDIG